MTAEEAKQVLMLYRPGTADAEEPEVIEAIAVARHDAELARWFEEQQAFQLAMRDSFRQIEVPAHLKAQLLVQRKLVRPPAAWWREPAWFAAAAAVLVLVLGLAGVWKKSIVPDRFANFEEMMVSKAVRVAYAMDWTTPDMNVLRQALAGRGAPANYELPKGLEKLRLTGGAALTWRTNPVSMVCFERPDKQMVFLFVMPRSALKDPPPRSPTEGKISSLKTVSWTSGDKTYLMAGPEEPNFPQQYL